MIRLREVFSSAAVVRYNKILSRAKSLRGDLVYGVASMLTSVVALQGNIIAARSLSPETLGVVQTLSLIPIYCTFLPFGVFNGLNRNIAYYTGAGNPDKVQSMVNTSWSVAKIVSAVGVMISLIAAAYWLAAGYNYVYIVCLLFVAAALVADPFSQHLEVVFMSSGRFDVLGRRILGQNLLTAAANLLPTLFGLGGLVMSRCISSILRLTLRIRGAPVQPSGSGSAGEAKELAVTGFPLLIAGVLYGYLGAADRSVIACFMGPAEVGQYSLSALVLTGSQFVPVCVATWFYPRLASCYGKNRSPSALRRYFWLLLWVNIAAVLPVAVCSYLVIAPLTERFLPAYAAGIPAAKVACISSLGYIFIGVSGIVAVIRKNTPYVFAIAASLALVWLLGAFAVTHGYGIVGAVWARTIATALLCLFTIGFAYHLTASRALT